MLRAYAKYQAAPDSIWLNPIYLSSVGNLRKGPSCLQKNINQKFLKLFILEHEAAQPHNTTPFDKEC